MDYKDQLTEIVFHEVYYEEYAPRRRIYYIYDKKSRKLLRYQNNIKKYGL